MTEFVRNQLQNLLAPFHRGHAMFMSSSALFMLFPVISAPIVARLYTPEDFGVYAVFFSATTILSAVSSLELRNVVLLEREGEDGAHGALLAASVVTIFSFTSMVVVLLVPDVIMVWLLGELVVPYLVWLPFTIFMTGTSQVLYTWATREKKYTVLARNKLLLGVVTMFLQIGIGLTEPGPIGFIVANLLGLIVSTLLLTTIFLKALRILRPKFGMHSAYKQFRKFDRLTIWTTPGTLVNSLCQFLPEILIGRFFGVAQLGQYSLATRMINLPIAFMSVSIQDFFRQQASEEFNEHGNCKSSFGRFLILTLAGSILFILPIFIVLPYVFPIVFGSQWDEAGTLVQAVVVITVIRFISSPLSYIWIIRNQQRLDFFWQVGLLAISLTTLIFPPQTMPDVSLYSTLWIYSLATSSWYLFCISISFRLARIGNPTKPETTR